MPGTGAGVGDGGVVKQVGLLQHMSAALVTGQPHTSGTPQKDVEPT